MDVVRRLSKKNRPKVLLQMMMVIVAISWTRYSVGFDLYSWCGPLWSLCVRVYRNWKKKEVSVNQFLSRTMMDNNGKWLIWSIILLAVNTCPFQCVCINAHYVKLPVHIQVAYNANNSTNGIIGSHRTSLRFITNSHNTKLSTTIDREVNS